MTPFALACSWIEDPSVKVTWTGLVCSGRTALKDLLISPARVDLGWKGRHPVVGQDALQRLPDDLRWVIDVSDGDKQVGAMDGESLSTDSAGA